MELLIHDLALSLGAQPILKNITFNVPSGRLTVLLGLNGAGKSTLIKALVGLLQPLSGEIFLDGVNLSHLSPKARSKLVAYMPQGNERELAIKVFDFVLMGVTPRLSLLQEPSSARHKQVQEALTLLGLAHLANCPLNTLSGGQKQGAYLARALVQDTPFLMLDEPTAYLDYKRQHEFMDQLATLIKQSNKGAVISLHDPNLALAYASQIIIIDQQTIRQIIDCQEAGYEQILQEALVRLYQQPIQLLSHGLSKCFAWDRS